MGEIIRHDINEEWAHAGIVEAGDFIFTSYCVGAKSDVETQVNGAFDHLEERLKSIGLTLDAVVKFDAMFRDAWNIPIMEKVIKERFKGNYPARKTIQTNFAEKGGEGGLQFQLDAIAYKG